MAKKVAVKKGAKQDPKWLLLVGRVLVAMLFVVSGWEKLSDLKGTAAFMASTGMPLETAWMAGLAGAIELLGGLALLVGWKERQAAGLLAVFLIIVTYFIHLAPALKMVDGMAKSTELMHVRLNLALLGGLLVMYVAGPGRISRDKK
jgi:putative oxidoreductase